MCKMPGMVLGRNYAGHSTDKETEARALREFVEPVGC